MTDQLPPLPPGFSLDGSSHPPLPPGFTLDKPAASEPTKGGGLLRNAAAGFVGALTDTGAMLSDPGAGEELGALGLKPAVPLEGPEMRPHRLNEVAGKLGFNPEDVPSPTTFGERAARAAGAGATAAIFPGGEAGLIPRGIAALRGAVAGAGGEAAAEVAPEPLKPVARLAGGLVAGSADTLVRAAPAAMGAVVRTTDRLMGPYTTAARERLVADRIANAASVPDAIKAALDATAPAEIVPGSKPTTFQLTGDMGLGALEREVQTKNPAEFQQRRAEQNTARREQLDTLQPTGNAADLANYVKGRVRWLDQQTEQDVADATRIAQERASGLGGEHTPEEYGAALRDPLQDARDVAKTRERALWNAIDPNGDLTISGASVRLEAKTILSGIARSAKQPAGDELHILQAASDYGTTVPFSELGALRTSLNDAMRTELRNSGQTQTYARLSRMRSAVERSINSAVERQAEADPQGVQERVTSWEQKFTQDANEYQGARAVAERDRVANESGRGSNVGPAPRGEVPPGGRPGVPPGSAGVQGAPTFDEAAAERLRVASQATRERADAFDRGPVGQVLAKGGRQDQYKLPDAAVGLKVFQPGPRGAENIAAYRQAVGDDAALTTLQDYIASNLKRTAMNADETLNPAKVDKWLNRYRDALRAFPELQSRFRNAQAASEALAEAAANRRAILDNAQSGALGKLAGLDTPEDVTRTVGGIFGTKDSVAQMRELAHTAGRNPDAQQGLRKAVADFMQQKLIGNAEAGTSGEAAIKSDQFQSFVKNNRAALAEIFSPEELGSLDAIAADLQRSNRSLNAVKIPGQSNTAQDLMAAQASGRPSVLGALMSGIGTAAATGAIALTHGLGAGFATLIGASALAQLRNAGIKQTNDLLRDAMLNPELARSLLSKAPKNPSPTFQRLLAIRIRNALQAGAIGGALSGAAANQ